MNENIIIREYKASDKNELIAIMKLNVPKYFAENEIEDLKDYLENKIEKYFVVEIENKLVGSGGINFVSENMTAMISWDFILPNYQGKGIGQKLLKHRIEFIKLMKDVKNIQVRTSQFAYTFYEKNGFVLKEKKKRLLGKRF